MFYEDFTIGTEYTTEGVLFTTDHIIEFAQRYDPQPFHLNSAMAMHTIHGGLIASGWHVFSAAFGAVVRLGIFDEGGQGASHLEEVQWSRPVRPGDVIHCVVSVLDKRESRTHIDRGYVQVRFTIRNQGGDDVAGFRSDQITLKRDT